ncbi:SSI family serine proteinase inhibitor [Nocardiopsis sp. CT-R113]|uniref:SSI family serine proteinase inhibitor n=1 Tax=Nocardiopsis codii TaxID=3065942 RepID=A0ABU7KGT0_9ACTN|nr:SSI family serine proteinase inhibitor [Nocardiopsis sp. CT-R113]MEE2041446.1 SSI family serine proteinase inhibitor [Nocardiopsis sp. CT-R113]
MSQHTFATALPARLAALAALGLLITACGNEPAEVNAPAPESDQSTDPSSPGDDEEEQGGDGSAGVELTIERSLNDDEALSPEPGYEEGTWTLTCAPAGGDHPDPEAACAQIDEVGAEPFVLDTDDMMCTMIMGGPEVVHVTGHVEDTEIDTEFNKVGGCEVDRFESVETVLNP